MKRFISLLLILCILLPTFSIFVSSASYSEYGCTDCSVFVNDEILPLPEYPVGSYATTDGKPCVPGAHYRCLDRYPLPEGGSVYVYGTQCYGFARYVFYRCFGVVDCTFTGRGGYYNVLNNNDNPINLSASELRVLFKSSEVLPGAHIRISNYADNGHSMIYLKSDETYIYTYECNYKHECDVSVIRRTWQQLSDFARGKGGFRFIHMPNTYPDTITWDCSVNGHKWRAIENYSQTGLHDGAYNAVCAVCGVKKSEHYLCGHCSMQSNCPGDSFIDMPNAEVWSHNPIEYVLEYGLLSGTGGSSFNPNGSMTRSMLVNVLWRIAGKPECHSQNLFSDVQENAWYTTAVLWASENRIASGVGNGRFNPNGDVTREQIAVILCNFTSWRQNDVSSLENITEFSDYRAVSDWAVNAMSWAYAHQIISGQANGGTVLLNPTGKATRAEVSSILMRYMKPEYDEILRAGIINSDYVNIRSGPGTTNSVVSYANIGTDVLILLEDNGWYRIRTQKGTLGYVRCDFID